MPDMIFNSHQTADNISNRQSQFAQVQLVTAGRVEWSGGTHFINGRFLTSTTAIVASEALTQYRLKFLSRIIGLPVGKTESADGFYQMLAPADGTPIAFFGGGVPTNPTYYNYSAAHGFYLPAYTALYWVHTAGAVSSVGTYYYATYNPAEPTMMLPNDIPAGTVFVASHESNAPNPCVKLGTGATIWSANKIALTAGGEVHDTNYGDAHTRRISNSLAYMAFSTKYINAIASQGTIGTIGASDRPATSKVGSALGLYTTSMNIALPFISSGGLVQLYSPIGAGNSVFGEVMYTLM